MPLDPQKVKTAREERGYTIAEVARRARMTWPAWQRIEKGEQLNARIDTVAAMARALGVDVEKLLS